MDIPDSNAVEMEEYDLEAEKKNARKHGAAAKVHKLTRNLKQNKM